MRKRPPDQAFAVPDGPPLVSALRQVRWDERTLRGLAGTVTVFALWLLYHPYLGIEHDAWLYNGQALARLFPERFSKDLFFVFGSQDSFTIFSAIHAWLIAWLGISSASIWIGFISQLIWITGAAHLIARLAWNQKALVTALLVVVTAPSVYGGLEIFHFGETWAVPRPSAEGLVLHAIALALIGRKYWSLLAVAFSGLLHPLVALSGLGVWFILQVLEDRRWLFMLPAALLALAAAAGLQFGPAGRLFEVMDDQWLSPVRGRNRYVFPSLWELKDWATLTFHFVAVGSAIWVLDGRIRAFLISVITTAAGGMIVSLIGGDWFDNVLIIQLQLWRANWLLAVSAYIAVGFLLVRLWQQRSNAGILSGMFLIVALWSTIPLVKLLAFPLVISLIAYEIRSPKLPFGAATLGIGWIAFAVTFVVFVYLRASYWLGIDPSYWSVAGVPTINHYDLLLVALPLGALCYRYGMPKPRILLLAAATLMVGSLVLWDRRLPASREIEAMAGAPNPFSAVLTPEETVYWRRGLKETWLLLQQSSYFGSRQGAGILFNRDTALTFADRNQELSDLDDIPIIDIWDKSKYPDSDDGTIKPVDEAELTTACFNATGLDVVILQNGPETGRLASWTLPVSHVVSDDPAHKLVDTVYYLYRCRDWR